MSLEVRHSPEFTLQCDKCKRWLGDQGGVLKFSYEEAINKEAKKQGWFKEGNLSLCSQCLDKAGRYFLSNGKDLLTDWLNDT